MTSPSIKPQGPPITLRKRQNISVRQIRPCGLWPSLAHPALLPLLSWVTLKDPALPPICPEFLPASWPLHKLSPSLRMPAPTLSMWQLMPPHPLGLSSIFLCSGQAPHSSVHVMGDDRLVSPHKGLQAPPRVGSALYPLTRTTSATYLVLPERMLNGHVRTAWPWQAGVWAPVGP